jgi:hypothetical protein
MRTAALHAPDWLVVIDNGSYETLTYFLSRAIAELWQNEHGGRLYKYEYSPPCWRAAKPRKTRASQAPTAAQPIFYRNTAGIE